MTDKANQVLNKASFSAAPLFAARTVNMRASAIREALKVTSRPDIISLAGGLPSPHSFPIEILKQLAQDVLRDMGSDALQYSPTEGLPILREAIAEYIGPAGIRAVADDIIVSTGSQGALDAIGKILINKGDVVAVESPTYLGALTAFNAYEPTYATIETDDEGVIPESLEAILKAHAVKFVYLVPTFQNPTGRTLTLNRRLQIAGLVDRYNTVLIEDDPYRELRFRGQALPPVKSLIPDRVVYLGTFSKVLAPGLRLGYAIAPPEIKNWMVLAKQGVDLHTSSFDQALACRYLVDGHIQRQILRIIDLYRPRLEAMLATIDNTFAPGTYWSHPDGGMFVWVECHPDVRASILYKRALQRGVAFLPGEYFFVDPECGRSTMRLNFTAADPEMIVRAVELLSTLIAEAPESAGE